ncbi:UNKNOWN [Stylonychia lemnae]|uniref:Uncharacterized protein n=1 Tax=Stylonychia lemnae TaxID=5949 RepID=A0A078AT79_STYLE|nr:UNKNOWN [Stylonychia lemnae]|eukprot:CDW85665.1 UNKNOWN [Stylonychia lemnae]
MSHFGGHLSHNEFFNKHIHEYYRFMCQLCKQSICKECMDRHEDFYHKNLKDQRLEQMDFKDRYIREYLEIGKNEKPQYISSLDQSYGKKDLYHIMQLIKKDQINQERQLRTQVDSLCQIVRQKLEVHFKRAFDEIHSDKELLSFSRTIKEKIDQVTQTPDDNQRLKIFKILDDYLQNKNTKTVNLQKEIKHRLEDIVSFVDGNLKNIKSPQQASAPQRNHKKKDDVQPNQKKMNNYFSSTMSNKDDSCRESSVEKRQVLSDRINFIQRQEHSKGIIGKREREEKKQKEKDKPKKPSIRSKKEKDSKHRQSSLPQKFGTFSNNDISSIEMGEISDGASFMTNFKKRGAVKKEKDLEVISISSKFESAIKKNKREQKQVEKKRQHKNRQNLTPMKKQNFESSAEEMPPISEQEMRMALFYMKQKVLKLVHLDSQKPAYLKQEEFFEESKDIQKVNNLLSILNVELNNEKTGQKELRHIIFGLNKKFNQVFEFQRQENTEFMIYQGPFNKFFNNSAIVIYENQLIITGGSGDISDKTYEQTYRYFLSIDPSTDRVHMEHDISFPPLKSKRSAHNAFVYRDYLFVLFGSKDDIEYLDLTEPLGEFKVLKFQNQLNLMRPMIFIHKDNQEKEKIYIFGGNVLRKSKVSKIYELEIKFQVAGHQFFQFQEPAEAQLIEHNFEEGSYGSSQFNQNMPNRYYYEDQKIWMFLDDQGQLFSFDLENKQHKSIDVKAIGKNNDDTD